MKFLNIFLLFAIMSFQLIAFGQDKKQGKEHVKSESLIKWYTFEEAVALQEQHPKTIFIDMFTDWCGWCKKMDKETFNNPQIAAYMNANYYPVKFNAERKDTIVYKGKTYTNSGTGRRPTHELAIELCKGRMSYPTIVYIDDKFNISPVGGYMDPAKIEPVLVYFAERINQSAPFNDFKVDFEKIYKEKDTPKELVNWLSFEDAIALTGVTPKKILLIIYSDFNKGSELLIKTTFADSLIADYVNKTFYCVKFHAESQDTLHIGEQVFINELIQANYPHQFAIALLQGKMQYPAVLFFNEKTQLINKIFGYQIATGIEPFLKYFGEGEYNNKSWADYRKSFITSYK